MKLTIAEAARIAKVIDARSPELEVEPAVCAFLDKLATFALGRAYATAESYQEARSLAELLDQAPARDDEIDLSPSETLLAAECLTDSILWAVPVVRLLDKLRGGRR